MIYINSAYWCDGGTAIHFRHEVDYETFDNVFNIDGHGQRLKIDETYSTGFISELNRD
jgi:hypothetical protein